MSPKAKHTHQFCFKYAQIAALIRKNGVEDKNTNQKVDKLQTIERNFKHKILSVKQAFLRFSETFGEAQHFFHGPFPDFAAHEEEHLTAL